MEEDIHLTETDARAGETPHVTRYVLSISLVAIAIIFAILLFAWR